MQRLLITGAAGFIGSNLCKRLLNENFKVIGIDNLDGFYSRQVKEQNISGLISHPNFTFYELDICSDLNQLITEKFDIVIHLAGKAGVNFSITDVEAYLQNNIIGTKNVLELMNRVGCNKIIFSSSSSVYGNTTKSIFSEMDNTDYPLTPYATSKKACELILFNYHNIFHINALVLRLFSVYGPNQRPDLVFSKFSDKIIRNEEIEIYGDGNNLRDYTEVSDVVESIILSISYLKKNHNVYEILNIGNSNPISINKVVNNLYKFYQKEPLVKYTDIQEGDMSFTNANISKAKRILGYLPKIEFATGINNFCEWYSSKH